MGLLIKIDICKTQLQRSNMDSLQQKLIRVARKKILIFGARLWTTLHLSMGTAVGLALRTAATMVSRKILRLARLTAGTAQCISYAYYICFVLLKNQKTSPHLFYGPITCIIAPNKTIETNRLIAIVAVTRTPIFVIGLAVPRKHKIPAPNVVIAPAKMLTPISP